MSNFYHSQYDYRGVQGDKIPIQRTLEDEDGGTVDLSGRTATLVVRHVGGALVASAEMSIDDASGGVVSYDLTSSQTSRDGLHKADIELTGGEDDPTTYPVDDPLFIYIREDVAGDDDVTEPLPEDGSVDTLDANAVGTASDPVGEGYFGSLQSQELSVSDSQPVTGGPVGDEGEFMLLSLQSLTQSGTISTTSTTYAPFSSTDNVEAFVTEAVTEVTNLSGLYVSLLANLNTSSSTTTASARIDGEPGTEISVTAPSFTRRHSPKVELSTNTDVLGSRPELKSSNGDEVELFSADVLFWGKIA